MEKIKEGSKISLECVGKLENGMVFIDTKEDGPIIFEVGTYAVLKGLNKAVIGMELNEQKSLVLNPEEAFGEYDESLLLNIPLQQLPPNAQSGMQLKSEDENGEEVIWVVKEIQEDKQTAVLDGNHILAGLTLSFDIKILEIIQS